MKIIENPEVARLIDGYPAGIRLKLLLLRQLIFRTAAAENIEEIEEALKWGEPSYLAKGGSTIRMDWKSASPRQYAMYFHCKTKLVDTFRQLHGDKLKFEGNRAIVFHENDELPIEEIKHCISLALTYHNRKNLPLLGA